MKIILIIEAVIRTVRQYLCEHERVTAYPYRTKDKVLLTCNSCGKFALVENPGKYWNVDDLADEYLRNKP